MIKKCAFTLIVASMVAGAAAGQQNSQILTGVNPRNITFEPVDTSRALGQPNFTRNFRPLSGGGRFFNFTNFFRPISLGSWPPNRANVTVLPPYSSPFQPNPIRGSNPFFGGGANIPQQ